MEFCGGDPFYDVSDAEFWTSLADFFLRAADAIGNDQCHQPDSAFVGLGSDLLVTSTSCIKSSC